jgi:hypothetical protein
VEKSTKLDLVGCLIRMPQQKFFGTKNNADMRTESTDFGTFLHDSIVFFGTACMDIKDKIEAGHITIVPVIPMLQVSVCGEHARHRRQTLVSILCARDFACHSMKGPVPKVQIVYVLMSP